MRGAPEGFAGEKFLPESLDLADVLRYKSNL